MLELFAPPNAWKELKPEFGTWEREINEYYWNAKVDLSLLEVRNLVCVSELIVRSALQRKESRGLHYTLDYPERSEIPENIKVKPLLLVQFYLLWWVKLDWSVPGAVGSYYGLVLQKAGVDVHFFVRVIIYR